MTKVVMDLTESDVEHANELTERLNMRNKAATVSTALTFTRTILEAAGRDGKVIVKNGRGRATKLDLEKVFG